MHKTRLFQVDLSSFFLQTSQEGQPIYEEIPPWQSEQGSDYVDTTSGYHTLPIESDYNESERGLFLVPVIDHKKSAVVSKDIKSSGEKFFKFQRKTNKKSEHLQRHGDIINQCATLDNFQYLDQSEETNCIQRIVDSKTIDLHNNPRLDYKSYQSNTSRQSRPVDNKVQRHTQDNCLPHTALSDMSGSDDWHHNDNSSRLINSKTKFDADFYERPSCPFPPDVVSNQCSRPTTSPSKMSTSDITVSPSSSESYPECRF